MSLVSSLNQVGAVSTGRLKIVSYDLAAGNYTGLRELQPGWVLANGFRLSNVGRYAALYSMVSAKFGLDGTLPNLLDGIVPIPQGGSFVAGAQGGEILHALTVNELPPHYHTYSDRAPDFNSQYPKNLTGYWPPWRPTAGSQVYEGDFTSSNAAGGGAAHNNMPPYHVVGCWLVKL